MLNDTASQSELLDAKPGNAPPVETQVKTLDAEKLASTLPPLGDGKNSGGTNPQPGEVKIREGRPCKAGTCGRCRKCVAGGKLGAPGNVAKTLAPKPQGDANPETLSVEHDSESSIEDFAHYGKGGAELVCGILHKRVSRVKREAAAKLPTETVERLFSGLRVTDSQRADLESFYATVAMAVDAPKGGGIVFNGITLHWNLWSSFGESLEEIRAEIAKLNPPSTP
jgi:hypothetical protein